MIWIDIPIVSTGPKTLESSTAEQFHLLFLNCHWHSLTPSLAPLPRWVIWSGYKKHNCVCPLLSPLSCEHGSFLYFSTTVVVVVSKQWIWRVEVIKMIENVMNSIIAIRVELNSNSVLNWPRLLSQFSKIKDLHHLDLVCGHHYRHWRGPHQLHSQIR